MVYEFRGHDGRVFRTSDDGEAQELIAAIDKLDLEVTTFDPATNGADTVYRSPEEEESDRCYTAWGFR